MYMETPALGRQIEWTAVAGLSGFEALEAAIVRAIVRGEQPAATWRETSLRLSADRIGRSLGEPAAAFASIRTGDLAEGVLALKDDAAALTEWARFILVATEQFRFADSEAADRLIGAIWPLAFGAPLDRALLDLARSLRSAA